MKKVFLVLCLLLGLCGCKTIENNTLSNTLDDVLDSFSDVKNYRINNILEYYSYYLPSDMSEETADSDSIVLKYNDSRIIMNLNIANIVNSKYYYSSITDEGFFDEQYLVYQKNGTYTNQQRQNKLYILKIYSYKDLYALQFITSDMNYYGSVGKNEIDEVVKHLLVIAKNTSVDNEAVVKAFSNKDVIDYKKKQINLFDTSVPSSGELVNILIDDAVIGDGIYLDGKIIEETNDDNELVEVPTES